MEGPMGGIPPLPPEVRIKMEQLQRLIAELQREIEIRTPGPADEPWSPPWKRPLNQYDLQDILDWIHDDWPLERLRRRRGLRLDGVELTQSVQFYNLHGQGSANESDNMIALVEGKELIIRAYVESNPAALHPPSTVTGTLRYRGKEISPLNGARPLLSPTAIRRNRLNDSLNFRIPAADCTGTINFSLTIFDPAGPGPLDPVQGYYSRITTTFSAQFFPIPPLRVTGVLIHTTGNGLDLAAPTGVELVTSLARFLPMLPVQGYDYNVCTIIDDDSDLTMESNWDALLDTLSNMRSSSTIRTFYVGLLPLNHPQLISANFRGKGRQGVAIAARDDTRALSHELGHACLLDHLNVNGAPAPYDAKYPTYGAFPLGSIGEHGLDTARLDLYDPQTDFDFMTYWENGNPPPLFTTSTWISPYHYRKMMQFIRASDGTADYTAPAPTPGSFLLLNFRLRRGGEVELKPSYQLDGLPWFGDPRPELDVMIDLIDRRERVIASYRAHLHNPLQDPDGSYLDFHELLPLRDEVAAVAVIRGGQELARWQLDVQAPDLRLEEVRQLDRDGAGDLARLEWIVAQEEQDAELSAAMVRYSADGGRTWQAVAADLRANHCLVNLDLLPGGEDCRFQVVISAGLAAATAVSEALTVRRKPRQAALISPQEDDTYRFGQPVILAGAAYSPDYGATPGEEVTWTSNRQGSLGSGQHLVVSDLRPGRHHIRLSASDGQGGDVSAGVWIQIGEGDEGY
jgi:hypothetical protein